jgi:hypothetical protein
MNKTPRKLPTITEKSLREAASILAQQRQERYSQLLQQTTKFEEVLEQALIAEFGLQGENLKNVTVDVFPRSNKVVLRYEAVQSTQASSNRVVVWNALRDYKASCRKLNAVPRRNPHTIYEELKAKHLPGTPVKAPRKPSRAARLILGTL